MAAVTTAANKRKGWNQAYDAKKKLQLLDFEYDVAAGNNKAVVTTDSAATVAAITAGLSIHADVATAADPWSVNRIVRTASARRMAKSCYVKPAVKIILFTGNVEEHTAVFQLCAQHQRAGWQRVAM